MVPQLNCKAHFSSLYGNRNCSRFVHHDHDPRSAIIHVINSRADVHEHPLRIPHDRHRASEFCVGVDRGEIRICTNSRLLG
jgi:hypothetical protein